jgi:tetratricopeptide (TPR) repeat protein
MRQAALSSRRLRCAVTRCAGLVAALCALTWIAASARPLLAQTPSPCDSSLSYETYLDRGDALRDMGSFTQAAGTYTCAIQLNPDDARAYNSRGKVYLDGLHDYDQALADFDRAVELDPTNAQIYNRRGYTLYQQRKLELAITNFDFAIQYKPDYALAFLNRGDMYLLLGAYDKARADFVRAIDLNVTPLESGYVNLGRVYLATDDVEQAESALKRASELNPIYPDSYFWLGDVYLRSERYDDSLAAYQKYVSLVGTTPYPLALERIDALESRASVSNWLPLGLLAAAALLMIAGTGLYFRERRGKTVRVAALRAGLSLKGQKYVAPVTSTGVRQPSTPAETQRVPRERPASLPVWALIVPVVVVAVVLLMFLLLRTRQDTEKGAG